MQKPIRLLDGRAPAFAAHFGGVPFADDWRRERTEWDVFECSHMEPLIACAGFPVAWPDLGVVAEPGSGIGAERLLPEFVIEPGTPR